MYSEDDFLQLSGIQHFDFCRRQWALIYIEQQWNENLLTTEGHLLHERVHDSDLTEFRADIIISRGMPVHSASLGISGQCDAVEFHQDAIAGIPIHDRSGKWKPIPVEYKHGLEKLSDADRMQLCCQAICLEEMFICTIPEGYLFYGKTRRRELVSFTDELRKKVKMAVDEMHSYFSRGYIPKVKITNACRSCSLKDTCLPELCKNCDVKTYMNNNLLE